MEGVKVQKQKEIICMKCAKSFVMQVRKPKKDDWCYECNAKYVRVRTCLCCHNKFVSEGVHNRLCTKCRWVNSESNAVEVKNIETETAEGLRKLRRENKEKNKLDFAYGNVV